MEQFVKGRAWVFGHDLAMDLDIFPFQYVLEESGGVPLEKLAHHVMETVNPEFGKKVSNGDFLVAGRNFGHGKAHLKGAEALKLLGVAAVIADSVASRFLKYSIYFGLPVLTQMDIRERISQGNELEVNLETGEIRNLSSGETLRVKLAVPPGHPLYPIMEAGGQIEYIKQKVAHSKKE